MSFLKSILVPFPSQTPVCCSLVNMQLCRNLCQEPSSLLGATGPAPVGNVTPEAPGQGQSPRGTGRTALRALRNRDIPSQEVVKDVYG